MWGPLLVGLIHAYDPEVIVVGGGVMKSGDANIALPATYVSRYAWTPWGKVKVLAAQLGNDAGLLGAVPLTSGTNRSMRSPSTYDKYPTVSISSSYRRMRGGMGKRGRTIGEAQARDIVRRMLPRRLCRRSRGAISRALHPAQVFRSSECLKPAPELERMLSPILTDDPVFGRMNWLGIEDFMDPGKLTFIRDQIRRSLGLTLVIGTGAYLLAPHAESLSMQTWPAGKSSGDSGETRFPTWVPTTGGTGIT